MKFQLHVKEKSLPQTKGLEHWHGAEGRIADIGQCSHVLRIERLQGCEVLEGARVKRREPEKKLYLLNSTIMEKVLITDESSTNGDYPLVPADVEFGE